MTDLRKSGFAATAGLVVDIVWGILTVVALWAVLLGWQPSQRVMAIGLALALVQVSRERIRHA